jgi:hypothetical protein
MGRLSELEDMVDTGKKPEANLVSVLTSIIQPCLVYVPRKYAFGTPGVVKRSLGNIAISAFNYADLANGKYLGSCQVEAADYNYVMKHIEGKKRIVRCIKRPGFGDIRRDINLVKDNHKTKHFLYHGNVFDMIMEFRRAGYRQKGFLL